MKRLLFVTKKYPFGSGEEFIETEINYLAEQFDEIIIFSVSVNKGNERRRPTPKNVIAVPLYETEDKTKRYLFTVLKGLFCLGKSDLRAEMKHSAGVKGKLAAIYAYARVKGNYKKINEWFNRNPEKKDIGTIYSYWFLDTAVLACGLKESLFDTARVYTRAHGYDLYSERNVANSTPFREYSLKVLDGVFPCSEDGAEYLRKSFPGYSHKINSAYLGTCDRGICEGTREENCFHIVTCSAIVPIKRVEVVAEAVAELEKLTDKRIKWTCIGDGPLLEAVKGMCTESVRSAEVSFKGYMKNPEVMKLYKTEHVDCFVNVSENEGLPVSIMEAQSFGIPVIATDVGGTGEIVIEGETGFLLDEAVTAKVLAEKLLMLCNLPEDEYSALRAKSRGNWEKCFNAEKNYTEFSKMLSEGGAL